MDSKLTRALMIGYLGVLGLGVLLSEPLKKVANISIDFLFYQTIGTISEFKSVLDFDSRKEFIEDVAPYSLIYPRIYLDQIIVEQPEVSSRDTLRQQILEFEGNEWEALQFTKKLKQIPKGQLRQAVLSDGYFTFSEPKVTNAMFARIGIEDLFDDSLIYIERKDEVVEAVRKGNYYYYNFDGNEGKKVLLCLEDRVTNNLEDFNQSKHLPIYSILDCTQANRILDVLVPTYNQEDFSSSTFLNKLIKNYLNVKIMSPRGDDVIIPRNKIQNILFIELGYATGDTLEILYDMSNNNWKFTEDRNDFVGIIYDNWKIETFKERLQTATDLLIKEHIKFDEPVIEIGQQDGILRPLWWISYQKDKRTFDFNGITYNVYKNGKPYPPEVCLRFILDVFERSSGTWFKNTLNGEEPEKTKGYLYFDEDINLWPLLDIMEQHPEMFDMHSFPKESRVRWIDSQEKFYRNAYKYALDNLGGFEVGDVICVYGLTRGRSERDEYHWHTYMVYETDPVTTFPLRFAEQPKFAIFNQWSTIMARGPRRYVKTIVRMDRDWILENFDDSYEVK
ncbi:hypothetical protein COU55_02430 [Candidatus Pacearchaeota archaeon CG10_big_fil_rev_8_21_14_0_10_31_59]|nr:MAG: hypothetical protein COU55_02430 [Candidatus Pacearchaeota archaeon CG10_big_fil_rev_8_21_14_0_10_31_59]